MNRSLYMEAKKSGDTLKAIKAVYDGAKGE